MNSCGLSLTDPRGSSAFAPERMSGMQALIDARRGITPNAGAVETALDQTSNGNNATQVTANQRPPYTANVGDGFAAIGADAPGLGNNNLKIATNAGMAPTTAMSLVALAMLPTLTGLGGTEPTLAGDFTPTARWALHAFDGGSEFRVVIGAAYGYCASGLAAGVWRHFVAVYDGSLTGNANRLKIYVNGVAQTLTFSGTIPASMSAGTAAIQVGNYDAALRQWPGYIDHWGLANRVITAAEALQLYGWRIR